MARQKTKSTIESGPILPTETPTDVKAEEAAVRNIQSAIEETHATSRALGLIEAFQFVGDISGAAMLAAYEELKKTRGWMHRVNPKTGNFFRSLEDYCDEMLPFTRRHLDTLLANRKTIGPELYEKAQRLGMRQKDYDLLKALPAPEQELIRRATEEATSIDQVIDILQEFATKHAQEKEALTKEVAELKSTTEAQEQLLAKKNEKIDALDRELTAKNKRTSEWPSIVNDINLEITVLTNQVAEACDRLMVMADVIQQEDFGGEAKEAATEKTGACYYDAVSLIAKQVRDLSDMCADLFGIYKDNARPAHVVMEELGAGTDD